MGNRLETLTVSFSDEDVELIGGKGQRVPDVLLIKAWLISNYSKLRKDHYHAKQLISCNEVITDTEYQVEIKLIDQRRIRQVEQYTYELNYYNQHVLKATVVSTYLEEVSHAV